MPVRDQLVTQITIGIASGDLGIGERLPSTRELARRFGIHANTAAAAYRKLVDQKFIEFRRGSGYFVREPAESLKLDRLIVEFYENARKLGFTDAEIGERLNRGTDVKRPDHFLVVDSDTGLRAILLHEIKTATEFDAVGISFEDLDSDDVPRNAIMTALFDEQSKIDPKLREGQKCIYLSGRSAAETMSGQQRPAANELIAIISGWNGFLTMARIMLLAAKIEPGNLIVRLTNEKNWKAAVGSASSIICDSLTAHLLPKSANARVFHIISDESIAELRVAAGK